MYIQFLAEFEIWIQWKSNVWVILVLIYFYCFILYILFDFIDLIYKYITRKLQIIVKQSEE